LLIESLYAVVNKNAILRFEVINECLSSRKGYSISELVEACNQRFSQTKGLESVTVKSRQVLYDMDDMQAIYGVDIVKETDPADKRKVLFSYPDGAKDIHGDRLLDSDYKDFNQAIWLLESLVGLPYVQKAAETLKKKIKPDEGGKAIFAVETNSRLANFDQLGSYFNHIRLRNPLKVTYLAGFEHERTFLFQPYFLKQYNERWFLFGWNYDFEWKNGQKGAIQNLAIDRIIEKRVDKTRFSSSFLPRENDIDFDHYFDDIIGVTHIPGTSKEHITIKVNSDMDWNRLVTKPLHPCQQAFPESRTISLDLKPNPELYATLCQFENIEILSPDNVREGFLKRIDTILSQYK